MSNEERKCTKCGGLMEDGLLYSMDFVSVGEQFSERVERTGWMAGDEIKTGQVGFWPFKRERSVVANPHKLTASRCTSCGLVELYAR